VGITDTAVPLAADAWKSVPVAIVADPPVATLVPEVLLADPLSVTSTWFAERTDTGALFAPSIPTEATEVLLTVFWAVTPTAVALPDPLVVWLVFVIAGPFAPILLTAGAPCASVRPLWLVACPASFTAAP
jgi:hypothetical protein